jgi:ferredoxin
MKSFIQLSAVISDIKNKCIGTHACTELARKVFEAVLETASKSYTITDLSWTEHGDSRGK